MIMSDGMIQFTRRKKYKSTSLIYIISIFKTVINHGLKKVDRKEKGIFVNDC